MFLGTPNDGPVEHKGSAEPCLRTKGVMQSSEKARRWVLN